MNEMQEKHIAYEAQRMAQARGGQPLRDTQPLPPNAGMRERAQELLGLLYETDSSLAAIRESIFGPVPTDPETNAKSTHQPSLEELICIAVQRAAQLASEARSIRERL